MPKNDIAVNTTKLAEAINLILEDKKETSDLEVVNDILSKTTINDWRGYTLHLIQLEQDGEPSLEDFNDKYSDKLPVIIKGNQANYYGEFPLWIYTKDEDGLACINRLPMYFVVNFRKLNFTTELAILDKPPSELHTNIVAYKQHLFDDVITPISVIVKKIIKYFSIYFLKKNQSVRMY